ncbi:hypothetical protein HPB51_019559 [Rhipicephalus microplus]|uniref:Uncharacterized protein n=1 Tax=Rhipicephalus microplus TaxID=6941 RepID=A0A9J6DX48_RHIMP|nr:hypothetical protein HPB51_019559 [Rhipicephalus microplus]
MNALAAAVHGMHTRKTARLHGFAKLLWEKKDGSENNYESAAQGPHLTYERIERAYILDRDKAKECNGYVSEASVSGKPARWAYPRYRFAYTPTPPYVDARTDIRFIASIHQAKPRRERLTRIPTGGGRWSRLTRPRRTGLGSSLLRPAFVYSREGNASREQAVIDRYSDRRLVNCAATVKRRSELSDSSPTRTFAACFHLAGKCYDSRRSSPVTSRARTQRPVCLANREAKDLQGVIADVRAYALRHLRCA